MANTENCSTPMKATTKLPAHFKGTYGTMYYVRNMKKSVAFYTEAVGLTPAFADENWAEFHFGGHALCLHTMGDKTVSHGGSGTLILEVTNLEKVMGNLKEKKVEFVGEVTDTGCGLCAEFKDLDGNLVSLYQSKN
jgi:predicted enzyme related to lactoylglutathione lyase